MARAGGQARRASPRTPPVRRWLGRAGALALVLLPVAGVAALVWWVRQPETLPVRNIVVTGQLKRLQPDQLEAWAAPLVDGGFFSLDIEALRQGLLAQPWIREVSVRRVFPASLEIHVEEHVPVARWRAGGFVAAGGEWIDVPAGEAAGELPLLAGPAGEQATVLGVWRRTRELLAPLGLETAGVELSERRSWTLDLEDGARIRLGRDDLYGRLRRFAAAWDLVRAGRRLASADLRYPNGFAVRWQTPAGG